MYPVWPASLPDPNAPIRYERKLPLVSGDRETLGFPASERVQTRDVFNASAVVLIPAADFQTFFTFWRDTLSNGKALFTAPWITTLGHPEYVARLLQYSMNTERSLPVVSMSLELVPDVALDPTGTFPDQWPEL